jgi:hypothetical protein
MMYIRHKSQVVQLAVMLFPMDIILEESFDECYKLASHKRCDGGKYREEEKCVFPIKIFQYFWNVQNFYAIFFFTKSASSLSCHCERHEGKVRIYFHLFLTSALDGDERSASCLRLL